MRNVVQFSEGLKLVTRPRRRKKRKGGRYHTGVHVSPKSTQECRYRSGWELSYMQWLDSSPDVVSYGYETVKIPYVSNIRSGKIRNYYPDFLVQYVGGQFVLVEIKPHKRLVQSNVKKKIDAAVIWCAQNGAILQIITEHELKGLGLLK